MGSIHIKLHLPDDVIAKYEALGSLEKVLSDHLKKTADFNSTKPLYITDALRQRIEKFFGRNFDNPLDLIKVIEKYSTIRVGDVDIKLPPQILSRLRSRHFNVNETFEQFLIKTITTGLEEYVGLR